MLVLAVEFFLTKTKLFMEDHFFVFKKLNDLDIHQFLNNFVQVRKERYWPIIRH